MDFDHRDTCDKKHEINYLLNKTTAPWARILEEVAKCDVVCVCCHRMRTWKAPTKPLDVRVKLKIELKSTPCQDCGKSFHYCQMDFDHVRGTKVGVVSHMKSRRQLKSEAAKCEVVCANCHRERTQVQQSGAKRVDPSTVDMTWKVKRQGGVQTVITPLTRVLVTPAYRSWHKVAGKITDLEVASRFGVTRSSVCVYRKKMGIPPFKSIKQMNTETPHV
jgi:hypothetical protein